MKILFYIDPIIEMGRPYFKGNWANNYCTDIALALSKVKDNSVEFTFIMNEPIAMKFNNLVNAKIVIFTQQEMYSPFPKGYNYLDITTSWYKGTFSEHQLEYYIHLIKSKLGEEPDIVITFSPVPFIKKAFPRALVLHHEYAMFSREPYPKTWYFDIEGMGGSAYLTKFWDDIDTNFDLTSADEAMVLNFKDVCKKLILNKSPYKNLIAKLKAKYDYLVLLPLQFSQYYLFDSLTNFKSQYDYLIYVLENIPANIGVLVTTHPDYDILTDELLDYCTSRYPNFIYEKEVEKYYAASQYLISGMDAVITISSSIGMQTLIWDNKLISLGDGFLDFIADSKSLGNIQDVLGEKGKSKEKVLFWILTHYAVRSQYISDPDWLYAFLNRSLLKSRNGINPVDFYDLIDEDVQKLFNNFLDNLNYNVPIPAFPFYYSVERLKLLKSDHTNKVLFNQNSQLFIDTGNGFCEESSIIVPIDNKTINLEFDLKGFTNIKVLRFDPVSMPAFINLTEMILCYDRKHETLSIKSTNADYYFDNRFWFFTDDPQIYLNTNNACNADRLIVKFEITELVTGPELDEFVKQFRIVRDSLETEQKQIQETIFRNEKEIQAKNEAIIAKDREIREKDAAIIKKDREIQEKDNVIMAKDRELREKDEIVHNINRENAAQGTLIASKDDEISVIKSELENVRKAYKMVVTSTSWKITKPLRYISNGLGKILGSKG